MSTGEIKMTEKESLEWILLIALRLFAWIVPNIFLNKILKKEVVKGRKRAAYNMTKIRFYKNTANQNNAV